MKSLGFLENLGSLSFFMRLSSSNCAASAWLARPGQRPTAKNLRELAIRVVGQTLEQHSRNCIVFFALRRVRTLAEDIAARHVVVHRANPAIWLVPAAFAVGQGVLERGHGQGFDRGV